MNTISSIVKRRSIKSFDPTYTIKKNKVKELIKLAMLAPSSFNLQHSRFVIIDNKETREKIRAISLDQQPVTTASLFIVLCADLSAWKKYPEYLWKNSPENVNSVVQKTIKKYYTENPLYIRDNAVTSCGLAAQNLMLAATSMGYASTPMADYNHDQLSQIIQLPQNHIISMCIAIGKKTRDAPPRAGNMDYNEVVYYNNFETKDN